MPTFERRLEWLPWGAGVAVGLIFSMLLWPFPTARMAALFLTGVALTGGTFVVVRSFMSGGKYDLATLQQEIEKDQTRQRLEEELPANLERVLCMCCGEEFDAKYPSCPNCLKHR